MIDLQALSKEIVEALDSLPEAGNKDPWVPINLYHNLGAVIGYIMALDTLNMLVFQTKVFEEEVAKMQMAQLAVLPQAIRCLVQIGLDKMPDDEKAAFEELRRQNNAHNN